MTATSGTTSATRSTATCQITGLKAHWMVTHETGQIAYLNSVRTLLQYLRSHNLNLSSHMIYYMNTRKRDISDQFLDAGIISLIDMKKNTELLNI